MLIKFETKSARVKGLAFDPKRKWFLASLHSGLIQLWDYGERTIIEKFDEHKGPVRGLDFHQHKPLFVSGGDDAKIKVWDYKTRRCIFTIDAHDDYIRTTYFHHKHPWILSASDDQSIRIWNWQSRTRIAVLTGHTHYVMCAVFHPSADLILSASVDQTLRLWNISSLAQKSISSSSHSKDEVSAGLPEILSRTDYSVESKEAHNSEVNWCAFHPTKQLCLSAADDDQIKIWRIDSQNSLREIDTLRGHYNNVDCAIFHPKEELVLSASEDRSVRVWDLNKRSTISTHRREIDRFWTIAAHPKENLFAAGHDTGLIIFKLAKERPVFKVIKNIILYIRDGRLKKYYTETHKEVELLALKPKTETHHHYKLDCYSFDERGENQILVSTRSTTFSKSIYDLYKVNNRPTGGDDSSEPLERGQGLTAIFIGPKRYAILDKSNTVTFRFNGQDIRPKSPISAEEIFEASSGRFFVKNKVNNVDIIALWDAEKCTVIHQVTSDAKFVVMSDDRNHIACISSKKIIICDGHLNVLSTIHEQRRIKSAAWQENGVLIYNTPVHVKYALSDGDTTTIVSVQETLYIMAIRGSTVHCINRNGVMKHIQVDLEEIKFKQAVIKNNRGAILTALKGLKNQLTRAEISFLVKKGHPGLALKYVKDPSTRFPLALQAFDIEEALDAASQLNDAGCWEQLVEVATQVGHIKAVEVAYKELKKPYQLAMLYLVSDQKDKMLEARSLARQMGDTSTEFIISLLSKDFNECAKIIHRCGHPNLAYTCAVNHGLYDLALELKGELSSEQLSRLGPPEKALENRDSLWMPSTISDLKNSSFDNWPMLNDDQESYEAVLADDNEAEVELDDHGDWDDDEFKSEASNEEELEDKLVDEEDQSDGWGDDNEELEDLLDDDIPEVESNKVVEEKFSAPGRGQSIVSNWTRTSDLALHHILAGSYKTAISFLQTQVGVVNLEPLKEIFFDLVMQSKVAYKGLANYPTMYIYPSIDDHQREFPTPSGGYKVEDLEKLLGESYILFSGGKFADAIEKFRGILYRSLFVQIHSLDSTRTLEESEERIVELTAISKEYILALLIWLSRKNIVGKELADHKRACELAAYFASLNLAKYRKKVLWKAFEVFLAKPREMLATKAASSIARRLLDHLNTNDPKDSTMATKAQKVKSLFDVETDQKIQLDYDDLNPFDLCAATFKPIYKNIPRCECPLCGAKYNMSFSGETCRICQVSEIGKSCTGIRYKATSIDWN